MFHIQRLFLAAGGVFVYPESFASYSYCPAFIFPSGCSCLSILHSQMLCDIHVNVFYLLKKTNEYWFLPSVGDSSFVICHARFYQLLYAGLVENHNKMQLIQHQTIYHHLTSPERWSSSISSGKGNLYWRNITEEGIRAITQCLQSLWNFCSFW